MENRLAKIKKTAALDSVYAATDVTTDGNTTSFDCPICAAVLDMPSQKLQGTTLEQRVKRKLRDHIKLSCSVTTSSSVATSSRRKMDGSANSFWTDEQIARLVELVNASKHNNMGGLVKNADAALWSRTEFGGNRTKTSILKLVRKNSGLFDKLKKASGKAAGKKASL